MKTTVRLLVWDMDGTMADLYGVDGWLPMLRAYDPTPYRIAPPMWDMERLAYLLTELAELGIESDISTWLSKESTKEYDKMVREAKRNWLDEQHFPYSHFHGVAYGTTKANTVRHRLNPGETAILFDDNAKVRAGWHLGEAIDPTSCDILEFLENLLREVKG